MSCKVGQRHGKIQRVVTETRKEKETEKETEVEIDRDRDLLIDIYKTRNRQK